MCNANTTVNKKIISARKAAAFSTCTDMKRRFSVLATGDIVITRGGGMVPRRPRHFLSTLSASSIGNATSTEGRLGTKEETHFGHCTSYNPQTPLCGIIMIDKEDRSKKNKIDSDSSTHSEFKDIVHSIEELEIHDEAGVQWKEDTNETFVKYREPVK